MRADGWKKKCKCCGETFMAPSSGMRYKPEHSPSRSEVSRLVVRNKAEAGIPIETFKLMLKQVKEDKGYSWRQIADLSGRSLGCITSYAHGKKTFIGKDTAEDIIMRLGGANLPPTELQKVKYTALARKDQANQRAETLKSRSLAERKQTIANLRVQLGSL